MSLIAHYIKTFTLWEFVKAHALTPCRHAELVSASTVPLAPSAGVEAWTLKQVQGDVEGVFA